MQTSSAKRKSKGRTRTLRGSLARGAFRRSCLAVSSLTDMDKPPAVAELGASRQETVFQSSKANGHRQKVLRWRKSHKRLQAAPHRTGLVARAIYFLRSSNTRFDGSKKG